MHLHGIPLRFSDAQAPDLSGSSFGQAIDRKCFSPTGDANVDPLRVDSVEKLGSKVSIFRPSECAYFNLAVVFLEKPKIRFELVDLPPSFEAVEFIPMLQHADEVADIALVDCQIAIGEHGPALAERSAKLRPMRADQVFAHRVSLSLEKNLS